MPGCTVEETSAAHTQRRYRSRWIDNSAKSNRRMRSGLWLVNVFGGWRIHPIGVPVYRLHKLSEGVIAYSIVQSEYSYRYIPYQHDFIDNWMFLLATWRNQLTCFAPESRTALSQLPCVVKSIRAFRSEHSGVFIEDRIMNSRDAQRLSLAKATSTDCFRSLTPKKW